MHTLKPSANPLSWLLLILGLWLSLSGASSIFKTTPDFLQNVAGYVSGEVVSKTASYLGLIAPSTTTALAEAHLDRGMVATGLSHSQVFSFS